MKIGTWRLRAVDLEGIELQAVIVEAKRERTRVSRVNYPLIVLSLEVKGRILEKRVIVQGRNEKTCTEAFGENLEEWAGKGIVLYAYRRHVYGVERLCIGIRVQKD